MSTPEQIAADAIRKTYGTIVNERKIATIVAALREAGMLPPRKALAEAAIIAVERDSLAAQLEAARQAAAEVQRHWQYGHQTYLGSGVAALIRTLAAPVEPQPEPGLCSCGVRGCKAGPFTYEPPGTFVQKQVRHMRAPLPEPEQT